MSSPPQIIARTLTFNFAPSVSRNGAPEVMEIALLPLYNATNAQAGATFAGSLRTAEVELAEPGPDSTSFDLIPSASPGLSQQINYRVMWRSGVQGRTYTFDFAMPDEDLSWDDLVAGVGNIINGEAYLQQTDLGVPGRVARLDINGNVIDAFGNIVPSSVDLTNLSNTLAIETVNREQADNVLQTTLESELSSQVSSTLTTAQTYTDNASATLATELAGEAELRSNAVSNLSGQLTAQSDSFQSQIDALVSSTGGLATELTAKADLSGGHVPLSEIPGSAITTAVPTANQTSMLALTSVYPGFLAIRPDGVWLLTATDATNLNNWTPLTNVSSVNGKTGAVVLSYTDVGAIPAGGSITQSQVTGLATTLLGYAATSVTTGIQAQVTAIQNDTTIVRSSGGLIADSVLPTDIALVNSSNQVTNKSGVVVASGGGGGGSIASVNGQTGPVVTLTASEVGAIAVGGSISESQVTGLSTDLTARVLTSDSRLTNARTPTAHANTHASSGSDPVAINQSQVNGLPAIISGNALTGSTNGINRVSSLEGRVTTLENNEGGGGTTAATTSPFWSSATTGSDVIDFTQVFLHSPFGIDSDGTITGTINTPYYLYTGVRTQDVAWPYITPGGHLKMVAWNESNAADPTYATTTALALKADSTTVSALTTTVNGLVTNSATQAQITTLEGSGGLVAKANQSDMTTAQTNITTLQTQMAAAATAASVTSLTTTVGTKAAQSDMTTAETNISTLQTTVTTKADLVSGVLKSSEIPTGIPQANISGLTTALSGKADLDTNSKVLLTEMPQNIPQSYISGLIGGYATLAGPGTTVPTAQLPAAVFPARFSVANRAAMLALTTSQVQPGAFCIITGTSDIGTYILNASDPSQFANWLKLAGGGGGGGSITSVNGYTGPGVTLTYTDVGALAVNAAIPISQVTSLQSTLNTLATTTALTTAVATLTTPAQVETILYNSSLVKRADYVLITAFSGNLAGQQSIDGVLVPVGARVLLTAQSNQVQNGLWVIASGNWVRAADFASASYLVQDTIIIVSNQTGSANGTVNNDTIWQATATGGFIDSANNTWQKIGYCAPTFAPVQGNGMTISGSTFTAKAQTSGGVVVNSGGIALDTTIGVRKATGTVPASNPAAITHNLNTFYPTVTLWDTGSNTMVLAGVQATSANAISISFANTPGSGQYQYIITG